MIWEPFINFVTNLLTKALSNFSIDVQLPDNVFSVFNTVFGAVGYFFPIRALLPIFVISAALSLLRITIVIIRFVKGFIPTMGG